MANNKGLMGLLLQGLAANKSNNDEIPVKDGGSRSVTIQGDLTSRTPSIEGINPATGVAPLGAEGIAPSYKEGVDYNILDLVKAISDKQHFSHSFGERLTDEGTVEGYKQYQSLADLMSQYAGGDRAQEFKTALRQKYLRQMLENTLGQRMFEEGGGDYDMGVEIGQRLAKLKELGR